MHPIQPVARVAGKALGSLGLLPAGAHPKERPKGRYTPRDPLRSLLRQLIERETERLQSLWEGFVGCLGPWEERYARTAERFLACGIVQAGFAWFRCQGCGDSLRVAFSCKTRLCPSCVRSA